jgi:hypothetical protein
MVVDYPVLRRRAPRGVEVNVPPLQPPQPAPTNHRRRWKASQIYCGLSVLVAILAIITGSSKTMLTSVAVDRSSSNSQNQGTTSDWFYARLFGPRQEQPPEPPKPKAPAWIRWILPKEEEPVVEERPQWGMWMIDPVLFQPQPLTDLLDKILTSTSRLLVIANLLLSITYLVHTAVANLFLDLPSLSRESWSGRERLGGFLVFKLLLISAVVAPDTLDLLILLSWYTLLSFLRSLAGLAAATTAHTSQSGQPPRPGVLSLLVLVLLSDFLSASLCVALFHGAGWGMVLLLTCDCALLAVDVISHILRHVSQTMDLSHSAQILRMEATQLALHNQVRQQAERQEQTIDENEEKDNEKIENQESEDTAKPELQTEETAADDENGEPQLTDEEVSEKSRQLDQLMERMESQHNRRLGILETSVFGFQLLAYTLTVAHFLHIWTLHGLQFTLIDGVLALHLHSALSAAGKKIAERRNLNRIARDLDAMFEDATEMELAKSTDVFCCICLGTMSTGSVKKVGCGHLYHTHCLREVVERARSMEAAKCPLCRASVLSGEPPEGPPSEEENGNNGNNGGGFGEHALFRFSTEGILPAWLPLPAFSFEVVRRPPTENNNNNTANNNTGTENNVNNTNGDAPQAPVGAQPRATRGGPSFLRRLLILAGVVPMSVEEEASALEQLVDMFPQYDRADLLRELRARGSAEGVVEAVLMGVFQGVQRGRVGTEDEHSEAGAPQGADTQAQGEAVEAR